MINTTTAEQLERLWDDSRYDLEAHDAQTGAWSSIDRNQVFTDTNAGDYSSAYDMIRFARGSSEVRYKLDLVRTWARSW